MRRVSRIARCEKLAHPPLGKIERTPRPASADESDVAAVFHELELEAIVSAAMAAHFIEHRCSGERDRRSRSAGASVAESGSGTERAGPRIVVVRIGKAMNRRRDSVVELVDRFGAFELGLVEQIRISLELRQRLSAQRPEEMSVVDSRESGRDVARSALQVIRHGDRRRADDSVIDGIAAFAEELEQDVPAERHAGQQHG